MRHFGRWNIIVRYNYIHHCNVRIRGSEGNQQFGGDQTYYQNVIANCTDAGWPRAAAQHAYYVYNNTFFDNGAAVFKWNSWHNCHFVNNIVYAQSTRYAIKLDEGRNASVFSYLDYNDYYAGAGNLNWFINDSNVASSLSQWQRWLAGQGTGADVRESHSVTTDPGFVNGSGRFDVPEDFKRKSYAQDGRRGDCPKVMGRPRAGSGGESLHESRRSDRGKPFLEPREIEKLRDAPRPKCPWLSPDGLALVFLTTDGSKRQFVISQRASVNDPWQSPQPLPIEQVPGGRLSWPFLTADALTLIAADESEQGQGRFLVWTRPNRRSRFSNPRPVTVPGADVFGRSPHFVESTGELVFSSTRPRRFSRYLEQQTKNDWNLWVVEGFSPR